jgi:N utilization substance protein A
MSKALIAGINQVAVDRGLDREVIFSAIEAALISAYKRNYGSVANVTAEVDRVTGEMKIFAEKEVVEEVMNPHTEVTLEDARKFEPDAQLGDVVRVASVPKDFGRIAAQTAKQVILQRIREAERDTVFENFKHRVGEIITAQVRSIDTNSGAVTVLLDDKHESLLPREEQIPRERLRRGDYIKLYIVDVHKSNRGPVIKLSRTHRGLLRRLLEQEIPEVREGTVEIKAISREPGARSKVAVAATVDGVDPVGSCVGMRGLRIQNIVNELAGEKIDVLEWSPDIRAYIANALSPAKVQGVILSEEDSVRTATVVVPDRQLSLAIGKAGQNARLAAKLTGWRIDIKSDTEARAEGLDLLAAEQAARSMPSFGDTDLLSRAEQILRGDDRSVDDLFRKAAEAIQGSEEVAEAFLGVEDSSKVFEEAAMAAVQSEKSEPADDEDEKAAALDAFARAAAEVASEVASLPKLASEEDLLPSEEPETVPGETLPAQEELVPSEDLPEVITADMLRARMAQRKKESIDWEDLDIEVPPELLAGLDDEDEEDEEEIDRKGKAKGKRKAKPVKKARKKPKRRISDDEDELADFL